VQAACPDVVGPTIVAATHAATMAAAPSHSTQPSGPEDAFLSQQERQDHRHAGHLGAHRKGRAERQQHVVMAHPERCKSGANSAWTVSPDRYRVEREAIRIAISAASPGASA